MKQVQSEVFHGVVDTCCGETDGQTGTRTDLGRGMIEKVDEGIETEIGRPHVDGAERDRGQEETDILVLLKTVRPTASFVLEVVLRAMTSNEQMSIMRIIKRYG